MNFGSRRRHDRCTFSPANTAPRATCCPSQSRTVVLITFVSAVTCLMARPSDALPQTGNDAGDQIFSYDGQSCKCTPFQECNEADVVAIPSGNSEDTNPCASAISDVFMQCCKLAEPPIMPTSNNDGVNCGYGQVINSEIIERITFGGDESFYGEFPWMVSINELNSISSPTDNSGKTSKYLCGGSLIHPQVVLTAAHSVYRKSPQELEINAGEWDLLHDNEPNPVQKSQVSKIIIHEKYIGSKLFYNDIALVFVTKPFFLNENVGILCLPPQGFEFQVERCLASGWGKNKLDEDGFKNNILKRISLPLVSRDVCQTRLRRIGKNNQFKLHDSFICAGGEINRDTCEGDGGSPLMCPVQNDSKQFHQAGIVSWGYDCGTEAPGVYTDVSKFRNWIDQQMTDQNLETTFYSYDNSLPIPRPKRG